MSAGARTETIDALTGDSVLEGVESVNEQTSVGPESLEASETAPAKEQEEVTDEAAAAPEETLPSKQQVVMNDETASAPEVTSLSDETAAASTEQEPLALFGRQLSNYTESEDEEPAIGAVRTWCQYILGRLEADNSEGPWRQTGDHTLVKSLLARADQGIVEPPAGTHLTVVTSLVAEFLKELPGAVLHSAEIDAMIEAGTDIGKLSGAIDEMSTTRRALLGILVRHWHWIALDLKNLMTPKYLAKACFMFLVDSKMEFQRTMSSKGVQYLLRLDDSIAALIEYVDVERDWPAFLEVSPFPEARPEIDERKHHDMPQAVTVPRPPKSSQGEKPKKKVIMTRKKKKQQADAAVERDQAPKPTPEERLAKLQLDQAGLEAERAAQDEKSIRDSLEHRPKAIDDDRDGCCILQ